MWNKIRQRIARISWVKKKLTNPVNLEAFRKKPTPRFVLGMAIIGLSYLMAWPLISVFGVLAIYLQRPLLFAIGSPIAYGTSYLVFMLGVIVAGKETVIYLTVFMQWSLAKGLARLVGPFAEPGGREKQEH